MKATEERYTFLFIKLMNPDIKDMFYVKFGSKIKITDE